MAWFFFFLPLVLSGCLRDQRTFDAPPPPDSPQAMGWWAKTVDGLDPVALQVLHDVSEKHREQGTSATYVWFWMGRTMAATYTSHREMTVPVPEAARKHMLIRLQGIPAGPPALPHVGVPSRASHCQGCTSEEAMATWRDAASKHTSKQ